MEKSASDYKTIPFICELCKHKTEDEVREAEDNLRAYLLLVKRICDRLEIEERSVDGNEVSEVT